MQKQNENVKIHNKKGYVVTKYLCPFKKFRRLLCSALRHLTPCFNHQFIVHLHNTSADNDQLLILMCSYMMWQWFIIPAGKLRKRSWTKFWERWSTTPG